MHRSSRIGERWVLGSLAISLWLIASASVWADGEAIVKLQTSRGADQQFILIDPGNTVATVILFAGGGGMLGLDQSGEQESSNSNFLVRSRQLFAEQGLMVAVLDAPSDQTKGMGVKFRLSDAHSRDVSAVASYLKQKSAAPIWVIGTSMGTFSAANAAIASAPVDGLVLTSTVTRARSRWKIAQSHPDGVASMALQRIGVPTLVVSHRDDACEITPAADASKLRGRLSKVPRLEILLLEGGDTPISKPCGARSAHGFLGIEAKVVAKIAAFIKAGKS